MYTYLSEDENTVGEYKEQQDLGYDLKLEWDDVEAEDVYVLYTGVRTWGHNLGRKRISLFKTVTERQNGEPVDYRYAVASGDKSWALKIAKKHKLEMPV